MGLIVHFKKAFNTVDHNILYLKWFESYLSNCKQFTRIDKVSSHIQNINTGVPQGSCLRILIFLICINDLSYSDKNAKVPMYAEDTSLVPLSTAIYE